MKIKLFSLIIGLSGFWVIGLFSPVAHADTLQRASDMLSSSVAGAKSTHTISFTTVNPVNPGGKIVILFPNLDLGDTYRAGTSSASTFMLNTLTDNYIKVFGLTGSGTFTGNYKNPTPADATESISLTLSGNTTIPANSTLTILLGCTSANQENTACATVSPVIFNPLSGLDSKNIWTIRLKTQDNNGNTIDTTRLRVNTNQGVTINAHIDQNFMMIIDGLPNTTRIQEINPRCIDNTDKTNSGVDSTSLTVGLGSIPINDVSIAAQDIIIGTNGTSGYVLIATSSSSLKSPETGFSFKTSPIPKAIFTGKNFFGIHPCGTDVDAVIWGSSITVSPNSNNLSGINKYAWPSITLTKGGKSAYQSIKLASHGTSRTLTKTTIEYAATTDNSVPSGNYTTSVMYTAMPIF